MIVSTNAYTVSANGDAGGLMVLVYEVSDLTSALDNPANNGKIFFYAGATTTVNGVLYPTNSIWKAEIDDENSGGGTGDITHGGGDDN